jgi:hypothetical protein
MEDKIQTETADQKKDRFYSRFFLATAIVLSLAITGWYYLNNPPAEGIEKRMKMFFAKNGKDVTEFLRMTRDEQKAYTEKNKHPFYSKYISASETSRLNIRGQVHNSVDYKPAQYWFNLGFMWAIFFATFWFIGVMIQAAIQINRNKDIEMKAEKNKNKNT